MKARTLVLTLLIGLMCFAGFGHTTADPAENSTADMLQDGNDMTVVTMTQLSVNVVTAQEVSSEIDWEAFRAIVKTASREAAAETIAELSEDLNKIYLDANKVTQEQLQLLSSEPVQLLSVDSTNRFDELFSQADAQFDKEYAAALEQLTTTLDEATFLHESFIPEGDVGWQFRIEKKKTFHPATKNPSRNPRDGLILVCIL